MLDVGASGDLDYVRHAIWNLFKISLHRFDKENYATLFSCEAPENVFWIPQLRPAPLFIASGGADSEWNFCSELFL